jgi:hypothetical protein
MSFVVREMRRRVGCESVNVKEKKERAIGDVNIRRERTREKKRNKEERRKKKGERQRSPESRLLLLFLCFLSIV